MKRFYCSDGFQWERLYILKNKMPLPTALKKGIDLWFQCEITVKNYLHQKFQSFI